MRCSLLIIDLQKAYYSEAPLAIDRACEYILDLLPRFRRRNFPVVWVQDRDEDVLPGQEGFELLDVLQPEKGDFRITKEYGNAFNKTGLAEILREQGVDLVIIAGFSAESCVLSSYRGALDYDLKPALLREAIASGNESHREFVLKINNILSYGVLLSVLGD